MTLQAPAPTLKVGGRNYKPNLTWSRRDKIYMGDRCIGIINLTSTDRTGQTVSLVSNNRVVGRKINWCVEQSTATGRPGRSN
jgi:hypothetical protein